MWDLDPAGDSPDALGPGVGRRECDPAGITAARITPQGLAVVESGQSNPGPVVIAALVRALGCPLAELHITGDHGDNGGYWDVICAALPLLTDSEITTVATVLYRISAGVSMMSLSRIHQKTVRPS